MVRKKNSNTLAENRKARHDYFVEETIEAGLELVGTEVKSIRNGRSNLKDSYADIYNGEVFIKNMHVSPYEQGNIFNVDPLRERKLLLHKQEIRRLDELVSRDGYTLIALSLYLKHGRVKVALGVCKGKKNYDKRDAMLEKAHKREMDRAIKEKYR
ncbi:MAG: SsrA-binding protein SmpB [Clostridium butyricum]|nr:SsrA-binding protein SmpB [Clostridium butyricum]